ncbi:MAG: trimeric intracellular cation channel family protein [Cyanobium sp.]
MPVPSFELPPYFDYGATFLWALSGALLGARKGYAIPGILTVSFVSSVGGGLLRDGLFLQNGPPMVLRTPGYLGLIVAAVLIILLVGGPIQRLRHLPHLIGMVDAIGLGAYAVVGMTLALEAGLSLPGVVLVGIVNAVGGGILRDVLMRREPSMFLPGTLEEVLALLGCLLFVLQVSALGWPLRAAAWLTIGTIFVLRFSAIRYGLRSKPLPAFRDFWEQTREK